MICSGLSAALRKWGNECMKPNATFANRVTRDCKKEENLSTLRKK